MRLPASVSKTMALLSLALLALSTGCALPAKAPIAAGLTSPFTGYSSATYADNAKWLCLPGRNGDACAGDLGATEVRPDGSRAIEPAAAPPAKAQKIDCFYVYPTVDPSIFAGNHEDFSNLTPMKEAVIAQAARFRDVCNVYAPLYRQMTIATYLRSKETHEARAAIASSDVEDAFLHYMGQWNHGHKIVLIGHSQGAEMVKRLLTRFFDDDPLMREKLIYAMPIGYALDVPTKERVGGAFKNIPLCERAEENGCIIAFRSYVDQWAGGPSTLFTSVVPGHEDACVSPNELLGNDGLRFSGAYFPLTKEVREALNGAFDDVQTPFLVIRDYYAAHCKRDARGRHYLAVSAAPVDGDRRIDRVKLGAWFWRGFAGLHILDLQLAQGDLVELIARKSATLP